MALEEKRKEAERKAETFQESPKEVTLKYPKQVFLIIGNEFCERLSYYGMKAILSIYLYQKLHFTKDRATTIYHAFSMLCYFCPIFGAMIADQFLGKFKTIVSISIIYVLGHLLKTLAAVPTLGVPPVEFSLLGLLLIAIGTGGIKPCVVSFGGDQFKLPEQERHLQSFFSFFYLSINFGSLIGTFMTPILREDVECFGDDSCYSLAFGVPAILMAVATVIIVIGKPFFNMVPPEGSILVKVLSSIFYSVKKYFQGYRAQHWMDLAKEKYDSQLVEDVKGLLRVLVIYLPVPVFWALYDQSGSRWTFQATGMNGSLGSARIKPDQMQIVNPILVMCFIPLFDWIIYPFFAKFGLLVKPLQRMSVGGIITALSFFASGFLELNMNDTYAKIPTEGMSNIHFMNSLPCMVSLQLHNNDGLMQEYTINGLENFVVENIEHGKYLLDMEVSPSCLDGVLNTRKGKVEVETRDMEVSAVYLGEEGGAVFPTVLAGHDQPEKDSSGKGRVRVVYDLGQGEGRAGQLTIKSQHKKYNFDLDFEGVSATNYSKVEPETYEVWLGEERLGNMTAEQGGVYSVVITREPSTTKRISLTHMLTTPNTIHMFWLLPQITIITIGEIMFSITGIEFAYSQAPNSMKSVVQAFWLLTTAFGNVIVIFVAEAGNFNDRSSEFFMFACLMLVDMAFFIGLAYWYTPRKEEKEKDIQMDGLNNNAFKEN